MLVKFECVKLGWQFVGLKYIKILNKKETKSLSDIFYRLVCQPIFQNHNTISGSWLQRVHNIFVCMKSNLFFTTLKNEMHTTK